MAQFLSHAHIEIILNGHRVVGLADDDPPYDWEYEDAIESKIGQDGGLYGLSLPSFGGTLTLKLQPASPSTQWCMQQEQLRKNAMKNNGVIRIYNGTFADPAQGVSWTMNGGLIQKFPATRIANQTYEAMVKFEELIGSVDGGTFHPPLVSSAA